MLFGPVQGTPYDIEFSLLKIPVRVHVLFWLGAILFAWIPNNPSLLIGGVICIFVSVIVHELGHAIVTRYFGFRHTEIWLYVGGGFATTGNHGPWRNIMVTLAGPVAGLLFFACLWGITLIKPLSRDDHPLYLHMMSVSLFINLWWSLFNLLPIWPLDGGQISRTLFYKFNRRRGERYSMILSMATAVITGCIFLQLGNTYPMMLLVYFGVMSYQEYERLKSPGRWWN